MSSPRRIPPRLDRNARVLGIEAVERLGRATVVVLGLGGVGSYAAEALARAGVGHLVLVDGERIEETNANRQVQAVDGEFGRLKAEVLTERMQRIARGSRVEAVCERYGDENADRLLKDTGAHFVVDAMDTVVSKLDVIDRCLGLGIPIVTALGAARRVDPTAVQLTDLAETHTDPFAKDVRKYLHRRHGIAASAPTGVLAVWSVEPAREDLGLPGDEQGILGARKRAVGERRREPKAYGSVMFVTAAFGLAAAAAAVQTLTGVRPLTPRLLDPAEMNRRKKKVARRPSLLKGPQGS